MGDVEKVLSAIGMKDVALWADKLRIECCEGIHVHWRDCRLFMSAEQFEIFARYVAKAAGGWDGCVSPGRDSVLSTCSIPGKKENGEALVVEKIKDVPAVHVHYGDLRIEMSINRFFMMGDSIRKALDEAFFKMINCFDINPFDHIHKPTKEEWGVAFESEGYTKESGQEDFDRHQELSKEYEALLRQGWQIAPIVVTEPGENGKKYQRRDGFCRYIAYLGAFESPKIPCYVVPEDVALWQPQSGAAPFIGWHNE